MRKSLSFQDIPLLFRLLNRHNYEPVTALGPSMLSIHMWGNGTFRQVLHESALRSLRLRKASLRSALVVRALEQAHFWREANSYLVRRPLDCAFEALDGLKL